MFFSHHLPSERPSVKAFWLSLTLCLLASQATSWAKVYASVPEALDAAFPGARIERATVYLTDAQVQAIEDRAGSKLPSAIVHPYRAYNDDGHLMGTAYFDAHLVRTLPETLMVIVTPEATIAGVTVLSFKEPQEYKPSERWYAQFVKTSLNDELQLKRGIDGVTGATLTARATTSAARRSLAIHHVLEAGATP